MRLSRDSVHGQTSRCAADLSLEEAFPSCRVVVSLHRAHPDPASHAKKHHAGDVLAGRFHRRISLESHGRDSRTMRCARPNTPVGHGLAGVGPGRVQLFEDLPMVLSHGDLCEMNFLVDENSGHLAGVIDWAEAEIRPFGSSLWGLENILGYMDVHGWHYFDQHADLRALFWSTFHSAVDDHEAQLQKQSAIDLARRTGILLRYGFRWDENMQRKVVQDGDSGTRYLDVLFLRG